MSIPIETTQAEYNKVKQLLSKKQEVICMSKDIHIMYLAIAMDMLMEGLEVKAKIKAGYK